MTRLVLRSTTRTAAVVMLAAGVSVLSLARVANAQGYGLYEQGTCQMGRAGAGVASPCDDGSAVFFNPAGLARTTAPVVSGGLTGIAPRGTFTWKPVTQRRMYAFRRLHEGWEPSPSVRSSSAECRTRHRCRLRRPHWRSGYGRGTWRWYSTSCCSPAGRPSARRSR